MDIATLTSALRPVLRQHGVAKAVLFGSYARGEPTRHSDVDLILVQDTPRRFFERYEGLYLDLCRAVPHLDLDVLIYTPQELERMRERPFIRTALDEGVVIHESDERTARS